MYKTLILWQITNFFAQKKVLIGGDSRIFWYNIPLFNLQKKYIIGYDSRPFRCVSGVIRGVFFRGFVHPFVHSIVHPNTKKRHFCPSHQVPFKHLLKTIKTPFKHSSNTFCRSPICSIPTSLLPNDPSTDIAAAVTLRPSSISVYMSDHLKAYQSA